MRQACLTILLSLLAVSLFAAWHTAFDDYYFATVAEEPELEPEWATGVKLPVAMWTPPAVVYDNKIYVVGYSQGGTKKTNVWTYNGATNWVQAKGLPVAMEHHSAAVFNNKIYVIGNNPSATNVYVFDGTDWSQIAGLPGTTRIAGMAVYSNNLYVARGVDGSNVWRLVSDAAGWTNVSYLPYGGANSHTTLAAYDGKLYSLGGDAISNVWVSTGDISTWTAAADLPVKRGTGSSSVLNNTLHYIGGSPGGSTDGRTNVFVFSSGDTEWSEIPGLSVKRSLHSSVTYSNKIYVIGGRSGSPATDSVEILEYK